MKETTAWDKRPDETGKSYVMFSKYLGLVNPNNPAHQTRSIARLIEATGYNPNSKSQLEQWSSKYDWVARAEAYDAHMATNVIVYRQVEMKEYQAAVVNSLVQQLVMADKIINQALAGILSDQAANKYVEPVEIQRVIKAIREKDDLARRAGKMPTAFVRELADETDDDDVMFVIGGGDE